MISKDKASMPMSRRLPEKKPTADLKAELVKHVRSEIGPIATPDLIQFAPGLPKTRSGKNHAPHPAENRGGTVSIISATRLRSQSQKLSRS